MAGISKVSHGNDEVYEAMTAEIVGGALVVPAAGATNPGIQGIATAGDAAVNVIGVAAREALPVSLQTTTGTDSDGFPFANVGQVTELTTVYSQGVFPVVYTAVAVAYGVKLCTAAAGKVRAWVSGTDPASSIIGTCRVVGGMSSAGGVGLAKIDL